MGRCALAEGFEGDAADALREGETLVRDLAQVVLHHAHIGVQHLEQRVAMDHEQLALRGRLDADREDVVRGHEEGRCQHVPVRELLHDDLLATRARHPGVDLPVADDEQRPTRVALHGSEGARRVGTEGVAIGLEEFRGALRRQPSEERAVFGQIFCHHGGKNRDRKAYKPLSVPLWGGRQPLAEPIGARLGGRQCGKLGKVPRVGAITPCRPPKEAFVIFPR